MPVPSRSRRAFLAIASFGVLARSGSARAQPPAKNARVAWLGGGASPLVTTQAFEDGLRAHGFVNGRNVTLDIRRPERGTASAYADLAARILAAGPAVILAANPLSIEAVTRATTSIPVVGVDLESDPVAKGWVASLARPGRNLTGFFLDIPELSGKYLQLLREVRPTLSRIAILGDARILKHGLPAICGFVPQFTEAGGLLAYGPDFPDLFRRAAGHVAMILKGTSPGDLPVQRPTKFPLVVNTRTAKALGLSLPAILLARADHVIE